VDRPTDHPCLPLRHRPEYLLRDRDSTYGSFFVRRVEGMGIKQKLISPRSPWQSPYVGRLVGSIRRECLDRIIVFNERQLRTILDSYFAYYHKVRPHRGLSHDSPIPRPDFSADQLKLQDLARIVCSAFNPSNALLGFSNTKSPASTAGPPAAERRRRTTQDHPPANPLSDARRGIFAKSGRQKCPRRSSGSRNADR